MKTCKTCGAQYNDDAVFCTNCGTKLDSVPVNPTPDPVYVTDTAYAQPTPVAPAQPKKQTGAVFGFLFNLFLLFYSAFSFLAIANAEVYTSVYSSYYSSSYSANSYYWFDENYVIFAFIMSFPLLAFGIVSFIFSLKERVDMTKRFAGITRLITGIALFLVAIIVMSNHC